MDAGTLGLLLPAVTAVTLAVVLRRARRASAPLPAAPALPAAPLADGVARIEVVTSYSPLAYVYRAVRPNVRLDGELHSVAWGSSWFDVAPGEHVVAISYPWVVQECGKSEVRVAVAAGEIRRVTYRARMIRFVPGKIAVASSLPAARALR